MSPDIMTSTNKEKRPKALLNNKNYAIVETSGSQFWLEPNRYYDFDRINADIDQEITIEKVLLLNNEKGLSIGKPYVDGASVQLKVMAHKRGAKIIVYKMRPKKKTRKKNGHRQELTRVMVTAISSGKKITKETSATKTKKDTAATKTKKETAATKTKKETAATKTKKETAATKTKKETAATKPKKETTVSKSKKPPATKKINQGSDT